jgi:hypothetical protein
MASNPDSTDLALLNSGRIGDPALAGAAALITFKLYETGGAL